MLKKKLLLVIMLFGLSVSRPINCLTAAEREEIRGYAIKAGLMATGLVITLVVSTILNQSSFYNKTFDPFVRKCCYIAGGVPFHSLHNINPDSQTYYYYLGGARIFTFSTFAFFMALGVVAMLAEG